MAEIPDTEPTAIQAGDTLKWTRTVDDYLSSDGWSLSYRLINKDNKYDISTTADGSGYLADVTAATTANYLPGVYSLLAWVMKGAERYTLAASTVEVLPNKAGMTKGYDDRLTAELILEKLDEAMLSHGASAWTQSYTIQGRSMTFRSMDEFMSYRALLRAEVSREKAKVQRRNGKANRNYIQYRI